MIGVCVLSDETDVLHEWLEAVDPLKFHFGVVAHGSRTAELSQIHRRIGPDVWVCRGRDLIRIQDELTSRLAPAVIVAIIDEPQALTFEVPRDVAAVLVDGDSLWVIAAAIHSAHRGAFFVSPRLLQHYRTEISSVMACPDEGRLDALTTREMEVLQLLGEGMSNAAIARHLVVASATVSTHVLGVLRKLGLSNRTEAALLAYRNRRHLRQQLA